MQNNIPGESKSAKSYLSLCRQIHGTIPSRHSKSHILVWFGFPFLSKDETVALCGTELTKVISDFLLPYCDFKVSWLCFLKLVSRLCSSVCLLSHTVRKWENHASTEHWTTSPHFPFSLPQLPLWGNFRILWAANFFLKIKLWVCFTFKLWLRYSFTKKTICKNLT